MPGPALPKPDHIRFYIGQKGSLLQKDTYCIVVIDMNRFLNLLVWSDEIITWCKLLRDMVED